MLKQERAGKEKICLQCCKKQEERNEPVSSYTLNLMSGEATGKPLQNKRHG